MPQHDAAKAVVARPRATTPTPPTGKNYLFVIAIDGYLHCPPLYNCVRDARQLIDILINKYSFQKEFIYTLYNEAATEREIFQTFRQLAAKITPQDSLIVFYSGHGEYDKVIEEGYWIPIDAQLGAQEDYIANSKIKTFLNAIHSLHTFLIVDSCFSGSLFTHFKNATLASRLAKDPSRWGLTAGRNEIVADGQAGKNSPFADMLLYQLKQAEQPIGVAEICNRVVETVVANAEQTPRGEPLKIKGHRGGQFFFYPKGSKDAVSVISSTSASRTDKGIVPTKVESSDSRRFLLVGIALLMILGSIIYQFSGNDLSTVPITTVADPEQKIPNEERAIPSIEEQPDKIIQKDISSTPISTKTTSTPNNEQVNPPPITKPQEANNPYTPPDAPLVVPTRRTPTTEIYNKPQSQNTPPLIPKLRKQSFKGKYGIKDLNTNEWILEPKYKNIGPFSGGLAAVQDFNYKWGYINKKGHVIIPFLIDQPSKFADANQIKVMINAQWVVINKQGQVPVGNKLIDLGDWLNR